MMLHFSLYPFRGTMKFSDVMALGSNAERQQVTDLQDKLQFDEPINIQFTSVR